MSFTLFFPPSHSLALFFLSALYFNRRYIIVTFFLGHFLPLKIAFLPIFYHFLSPALARCVYRENVIAGGIFARMDVLRAYF